MRRALSILLLCLLALPFTGGTQVTIQNATLQNVKFGTSAASGASNLAVDTILDFHAQTLGQAYNTNLIQGDVWGNTNNWTVTSEGTIYPPILTNVIGPDFAFSTPIQTPDGHIATSTGTNWVREDLSADGGSGTAILLYSDLAGMSLCSATFYEMFTNISAAAINSRDVYVWYGNPYESAQLNYSDSNPGGQVKSGVHSSLTGASPSTVTTLATNLWIKGEVVWHATNGLMFVSYYKAPNNEFIFSSVGYGDPDANVQNFFRFEAGYITTLPISGFNIRGPVILALDGNVSTNRPPWVPNAPTGVSSVQTGDGQVSVGIIDNNFMLNSNLVSMSNATEEITGWIQPQLTNATISGLTGGHTYDVRATAYFLGGVKSSTASGTPITLTTATWYDTIAFASCDSSIDQTAAQFYRASSNNIAILSSGTCSKVRIGIAATPPGTTPIKFAIYDGAGNLVNNWETLSGTSSGLIEFSVPSPFSVSPGNYTIAYTANCNSGTILYSSKSGTTGTQGYNNPGFDYAGFPDSTLGTSLGNLETISAGMLIQ